jgi:uncharacterized protein (TIGR03083 family)
LIERAIIETSGLFPKLSTKLIQLLESLTAEEWDRFALPKWRVKDVVAHLLDSALRRLSIARDGYFGEKFAGSSYDELLQFLNGLNADWVKAFRRISPQVLIGMMREAERELSAYLATLDPHGTAPFAVAWAGESSSENWFDTAREYTERWHHQQQIREAVGKPGIMTRELYYPVLDTFMQVLPHAYRDVQAPEGAALNVSITGEAGGEWYLTHRASWTLSKTKPGEVSARVEIPHGIAWRLFTKGLNDSQKAQVRLEGDRSLSEQIWKAVAVMA